jgi:hypothetical protein
MDEESTKSQRRDGPQQPNYASAPRYAQKQTRYGPQQPRYDNQRYNGGNFVDPVEQLRLLLQAVPIANAPVQQDYSVPCLPLVHPAVQTIAAQSKQINALLCPVAKAVKEKLLSVLKDNVLIYTDMAPQEVAKAMDLKFPYHVAKDIPHIETDISKYDKQQGILALLTTKKIYMRLGCDPDIAELIVKCNIAATLQASK